MISLCGKQLGEFTDYEKRLLIFNYLYRKKGIQKIEIYNVRIIDTNKFRTGLVKAYKYFRDYI